MILHVSGHIVRAQWICKRLNSEIAHQCNLLYSVHRIFVGFQFLQRSKMIEYFVGVPFSS